MTFCLILVFCSKRDHPKPPLSTPIHPYPPMVGQDNGSAQSSNSSPPTRNRLLTAYSSRVLEQLLLTTHLQSTSHRLLVTCTRAAAPHHPPAIDFSPPTRHVYSSSCSSPPTRNRLLTAYCTQAAAPHHPPAIDFSPPTVLEQLLLTTHPQSTSHRPLY